MTFKELMGKVGKFFLLVFVSIGRFLSMVGKKISQGINFITRPYRAYKKEHPLAHKRTCMVIQYLLLSILTIVFLLPIIMVVYNSFKDNLFVTKEFFKLPNAESWAGFSNYLTGLTKTKFFTSFFWSCFITVLSVAAVLLFTSMTAWMIIRLKDKFTKTLYYVFVFSMIVPFQMVMFTMTYIANRLYLNNPFGIIFIYVGFGAGLSVFMFSGFIKSIPFEIEEAATIDGCNPPQTFFLVILPILKSTCITVAILNAMWIWNDYLLPYLILSSKYKTVPIAVQGAMLGLYGNVDMGSFMAMLVVAIVPIVIFYLACQKYIIKGVVAGAVKG